MSGPPAAAPLSCPGCDGPMEAGTFDAHYGRSVELDVCHGCGLIWFDGRESVSLTPGAVLRVFITLDAHRDRRHPLQRGAMGCPRCRRRLLPTVDRQRNTAFSYWRCPAEEGRLTTFFDFLREKDFVRPLSAERLAELRAYARTVHCSACGAPIDLARESVCEHCRAPLSMLDPGQVRKVVSELQEAEQRRTTIDPTFPARLLTDRAGLETAFRTLDRDSFGLVESGVSALVRLLADPPALPR